MNSLKAKLIMVIITFIVAVGDVNAGCQNDLFNTGYSSNDGVTNCVNLFTNFANTRSLNIHEFETFILKIKDDDGNDNTNINFIDKLYVLYLIKEINKIEIYNVEQWCNLIAAQVKGTEDDTPNETIVKQCIDELTTRGYVYKSGFVNYIFSKKEPSLLQQYTDHLINEEAYITDIGDKKKNVVIDKDIPSTSHYSQAVKSLYSHSWCKQYAENGDIIGYSEERKAKIKKYFKNQENDLQTFLYYVCIGILKADGFNHVNATDSYAFIKVNTRFITPYNKYLVDEATKCKIDGTCEWCSNNNYPVDCLDILTNSGYNENNTTINNYNILESKFKSQNTLIDLSNYQDNELEYENIIKTIYSDDIVRQFCKKLLHLKSLNQDFSYTTSQFCAEYSISNN